MKISFKTGGRGKVTVLGDGQTIAAVDEEFLLTCGYKENDEIEGAQAAAFIEAACLRSAFLGAMRLIALRDHGKKELENKLVAKGHKRVFASQVCDDLENKGYIDDRAFAFALAGRLCENKGYSERRIKSELYQKGIARDIIDEVCQSIDNEPILRIIELLNTKFSGKLSTEKGIKKTFAALQRMGYGYSDIRSAMAQVDISTPED
ncbi:MAG: regulatory protein RecX [Clostridia bacterium]|nr:regulatory protein RecX [Clostridia bacterium]